MAAFFLNPKLQFNPAIIMDNHHMGSVLQVFEKLHPELDGANIGREVFSFDLGFIIIKIYYYLSFHLKFQLIAFRDAK